MRALFSRYYEQLAILWTTAGKQVFILTGHDCTWFLFSSGRCFSQTARTSQETVHHVPFLSSMYTTAGVRDRALCLKWHVRIRSIFYSSRPNSVMSGFWRRCIATFSRCCLSVFVSMCYMLGCCDGLQAVEAVWVGKKKIKKFRAILFFLRNVANGFFLLRISILNCDARYFGSQRTP